ncbi:hypothetical protein ACRC7T_18725 (plasmid) [Segnochrobactraceae bacterium EtOH-i3]
MEPDEQLTTGEAKMLAATSELVAVVFGQVRREFDSLPDRLTTDPDLAGRVRAQCAASLARIHDARIGAGPDLAAELDIAIRFAMGRLIVAMNGAAAGREVLDVR